MIVENFNGLKVTRVGKVTFICLPQGAWREIEGGCSCPYCTPDRKYPQPAYWDTLSMHSEEDRAYTVHYPALHGATLKRRGE